MALVIVSQPFPESVKQQKPIDEPVTVRLLTGAKVDLKPNSMVVAEILNFNTKNKKHIIGIENAEKPLNQHGLAVFNDLKVNEYEIIIHFIFDCILLVSKWD
jgi:hypothetical protein